MKEEEFKELISKFVEMYSCDGWELLSSFGLSYAYNPRKPTNKQLNGYDIFANYYINLDSVFNVPVLSATFFTALGAQLSYAELHSLLEENLDLGSVSEREHELTGKPVFYIHPCRTQEFIEPFLKIGADYLHVWMNRYGPVFFYRLPF